MNCTMIFPSLFCFPSEKHAVVLDIGTAYTKVGYAGESSPRAILKTPPTFDTLDKEVLHDVLVGFVHRLYFEVLLVNPKDRRVVLLESLLGETRLKDELVEVLFNHFEVLSILFAPSHLMPLYGLGLQNALVVDVGFSSTSVIPVYQSVPILKAWQALPLGGQALHESIKKEICCRGTIKVGAESEYEKFEDQELSEDVVEDIKVRLCFVPELSRGQQIQQIRQDASTVSGLSSFLKRSVPAVDYTLSGEAVLKVDGQTREGASEVLFEQDNDRLSLSTMVLDALITAPIGDVHYNFVD